MELLKKYFAGHFPDDKQFWKTLNETSPVKDEVEKLCAEHGISKNTEILSKLYFVAKVVRFRSENVTPKHENKKNMQYKRELFNLFMHLLKKRSTTTTDKPIFQTLIAKEHHRSHYITDPVLLSQYEDFIFDTVSEMFIGKKWNQLNQHIEYEGNFIDESFRVKNDERGQIITEVQQWLNEFGTPEKGLLRNQSYFTGLFLRSVKKFIKRETDRKYESDRQLHFFMGKLCVLIGILHPGDRDQIIKEIENKLRAVNS
ncbi:hypothetical protein SAMN05444280_11280 [Tangfeifania diversioriginum]|uniref:Uncharacterized protein n=1 Tax=Tangfeifania diversioriginum TaxID=1168035 RepID=A0A1M6H4A9_9BACT|nr:hypothetical protein [Tangfeifania diversioriginum]SHJ17077.1 hypothetical protein SAMN05444280_11280 [Tangfeifania diversioriginum]